jgi:hypothetical protein
LHLLGARLAGEKPDDALLASCILTDPIGFLVRLTAPGPLGDAVPGEASRATLAPLLGAVRGPHRNAAVAEAVLRLLLDQPQSETDPAGDDVRGDYLRAIRALAALSGGKPGERAPLIVTPPGKRFAAAWPSTKETLRKRLRF